MKKVFVFVGFYFAMISFCEAQPLHQKKEYNLQDTLRGSITKERAWWNVLRYDIAVTPDYTARSIKGQVKIVYEVLKKTKDNLRMQIDLQEPMQIDNVYSNDGQTVALMKNPDGGSIASHQLPRKLKYTRLGNVYYIEDVPQSKKIDSIIIEYSGNPRVAVNPPWDGGWIFTKDEKGRPWMSVACQGLGASVWYPCKDHQSDEPDNGASLTMTVPDTLVAVGNGRLISKTQNNNGTATWMWAVKNPINNYNIIPYIGKYVTWHEDYMGEKGKLDCDYWVLDYDLEKAQKQFAQVKQMLSCFEFWMGPYPFYEDSYKLVEAPHLGMEHQSAVAYGNKFKNGYLGMDLSGSGFGKNWDYIIVHESGHEWFANNITTNDIADMWVHEGFTDYSETLFVQCLISKEGADKYTQGLRRGIRNDLPVIGPYGVNQEGSGDMYNKGNNLIHTIRQIINDDTVFRQILRGLNKDFYHKTVNSKDVEAYISKKAKKDFSKIFDQYLRTTQIPVLEYKIVQQKDNADQYEIQYKFTNCIKGFSMPVRLLFNGKPVWINANENLQTTPISTEMANTIPNTDVVDKNFYIKTKMLK